MIMDSMVVLRYRSLIRPSLSSMSTCKSCSDTCNGGMIQMVGTIIVGVVLWVIVVRRMVVNFHGVFGMKNGVWGDFGWNNNKSTEDDSF